MCQTCCVVKLPCSTVNVVNLEKYFVMTLEQLSDLPMLYIIAVKLMLKDRDVSERFHNDLNGARLFAGMTSKT